MGQRRNVRSWGRKSIPFKSDKKTGATNSIQRTQFADHQSMREGEKTQIEWGEKGRLIFHSTHAGKDCGGAAEEPQ